jgi:hypothetical protein
MRLYCLINIAVLSQTLVCLFVLNIEALPCLVPSVARMQAQLHAARNSIYEKLKTAEVKTRVNIANNVIQLRSWNYDKE